MCIMSRSAGVKGHIRPKRICRWTTTLMLVVFGLLFLWPLFLMHCISMDNNVVEVRRLFDEEYSSKVRTERVDDEEESFVFNETLSSPWNDMKLVANSTCGVDKCFFRSISDEKIGYLVSGGGLYKIMKKAYKLTREIEDHFGIKHFYLESIRKLRVSQPFQQYLNGLVYQPNRDMEVSAIKDNGCLVSNRRGRNSPILTLLRLSFTKGWNQSNVFLLDDDEENQIALTVQKVRVAPNPHLFLALHAQNRQVTLKQIDSFKQMIPDTEAFKVQFTKEINLITKVCDKYPRVRYDFQGIVDLQGNFYFLDMDSMINCPRDPLPQARGIQLRKLRETLNLLTSSTA